jgi:hypothetical protein
MSATNVLPLQTEHHHRGAQVSHAEQSGQAIVSMLRQAADVAKRNEERAKAQAQAFGQELRAARMRIESLEAELDNVEQRALEAEDWLLRVFQEVKAKFIEPMTDRSAAR